MARFTRSAARAGAVLAAVVAASLAAPTALAATERPTSAAGSAAVDPAPVADDGDGVVGPGQAPADDAETPSTEDERVLALQAIGQVPDGAWLGYSDKDFVFAVWRAVGDAQPEVRAAAEIALTGGTPEDLAAFIRFGIHEAKQRDDDKAVRDAETARQARELKRSAAAVIGVVPDAAMLLLPVRDFIYELWRRADGPKVKEAALAAFGGTAEQQQTFLTTGIREAHQADQDQAIADDQARTEQEKAVLAAKQAKARAAATVLGMVIDDGVQSLSDDNFVRFIYERATDPSEVRTAAFTALVSPDPTVWKAFIDTGIYEASRRDIQNAIDKKAAADRAAIQKILTAADADGHKNLSLAARAALAGGPVELDTFLRVGQHQVRPDLPDVVQSFYSGLCMAIGSASKENKGEALQYSCNGKAEQQWELSGPAAGPTRIRNVNSGKCLGVAGGSKKVGDPVIQWTCSAAADQQWTLESDESGPTQVRNRNSTLCLALKETSKALSVRFVQATCKEVDDQLFRVQSRGLASVATGDLNGDGRTDLVATDMLTGKLWLYPGTAAGGSWGPRRQIGTSGWTSFDIAVGDFTGDGLDDIVAFYLAKAQMYVYPNTGNGALGTRTAPAPGGKAGSWGGFGQLTVGDITGDGHDDIVLVSSKDGKLHLFRGGAAGSLGADEVIGSGGWNGMGELTAGFFNGDAYADLVAVQRTTGTLRMYPGSASGRLGTPVDLTGGGWNGQSKLVAGRFDRDEVDDLAAFENATSKHFLWPGKSPQPGFGSRVEIGIGG